MKLSLYAHNDVKVFFVLFLSLSSNCLCVTLDVPVITCFFLSLLVMVGLFFQPIMYGRCVSQTEGATASILSHDSSVVGIQSAFVDPSEEDLQERLEHLRDTRIRLELQLPTLARVSSEEDLLSTDMSLAGSMEDISGMSVPSTPSVQGCEDSDTLLLSGKVKI